MRADLAQLLSGMGRPSIAVVGDAISDEYIWGEVERISPEAPIPVLKATRSEYRAGGAGSVVANLRALDVDVHFFSVRGDDAAGSRLASLFERDGACIAGLLVDKMRPTTSKTRHVGFVQHANRAMQQLLRVDHEVRKPIEEGTIDALVRAFRAQAKKFDVVLVSDYRKGLISEELLARLRDAAPGVPFFLDPALLKDYSLYRGVDLICPNRYEAGLAAGREIEDVSCCRQVARQLAGELDVAAVAVTMDREGIFLHERKGVDLHFPTKARVVADVSGAGDMVLSLLGLVVAAGGTLEQGVELANVAAGIEVRKMGATPVSRTEILQELRYGGHPGAAKIKKREELLPAVEAARQAGKSIVFTNGCFDLLHFGHQHLLNGAAQEGDLLIVAVNNDASIRRLKGPDRPQTEEEVRLLMIAALEAVDYVTSFEEDTPIPLLETLRPDVLVKGEEYRTGTVVGREVVEGYGGRIAFVSQVPGISTTSLLARGVEGANGGKRPR